MNLANGMYITKDIKQKNIMANLKYSTKDTLVMIDAFSKLSEEGVSAEEMKDCITSLCKYPVEVVEKFIAAANAVSEKVLTPENSLGVLAYITIRINL